MLLTARDFVRGSTRLRPRATCTAVRETNPNAVTANPAPRTGRGKISSHIIFSRRFKNVTTTRFFNTNLSQDFKFWDGLAPEKNHEALTLGPSTHLGGIMI